MIKGIADWLEKVSAGSMLIGLSEEDNADVLWLGIAPNCGRFTYSVEVADRIMVDPTGCRHCSHSIWLHVRQARTVIANFIQAPLRRGLLLIGTEPTSCQILTPERYELRFSCEKCSTDILLGKALFMCKPT